MSNCTVIVVPALQDNYMYLIIDNETKTAAAVDPIDTNAIRKAASDNQATITTILTTHNHWDHSGGNLNLIKALDIDRVYGGIGDNVPGCTNEVGDGSTFLIGTSTQVKVLFTPCHTQGHVCYYIDNSHVFTGDTMFVSGAGNFNTGTPEQMTDAFDKILGLPDDTNVWVGHEYTAKNCAFACYCEPDNEEVQKRLEWAMKRGSRHDGQRGTVPSTIGMEKACNPFARIDTLDVMEFCGPCGDGDNDSNIRSERMRLVRKGKDDWGSRGS